MIRDRLLTKILTKGGKMGDVRELFSKKDSKNSGLLSFLKSKKGQTLVEYGLLLVLIAIVIIFMLRGTGQQVNEMYSKINSGLLTP